MTGDGFCKCGCGGRPALARQNASARGDVRGVPVAYISGHANTGKRGMKGPRYVVDERTGCWNWAGFVHCEGYGYGTAAEGGSERAHRIIWKERHGDIPDGLTLDHLCRNRRCVNPDHLEPVTRQVNVQRGRQAKLNPTAVKEIRNLDKEGVRRSDIALRFGVGQSWISRVISGQKNAWANIQ